MIARLIALVAAAVLMVVLAPTDRESRARAAKTHPRVVLLVRHAEKPPEAEKSFDLSGQGKKRAEAFSTLFKKSDTRPDPFPTPDFIFATKNSKQSHRPLETVTPLAKRLKLTVNDEFADDDVAGLAAEVFKNDAYAGKVVLICWHHGKLPKLARELKATDAPKEWDDTVFDRVWVLAYDEQGQATFNTAPQRLLPDDAKK